MFEGNTDILLTMDGDLAIEQGDLALTSGMDWYSREINKRLRSGTDWKHHPDLGVGLEQYIGFPNSRETGRRIEDRVSSIIAKGAIHFPASLEVKIVPVTVTEVQLFIILTKDGEREVVIDQILNLDRGLSHPVADAFFARPSQVPVPPAKGYKTNTNKYIGRLDSNAS